MPIDICRQRSGWSIAGLYPRGCLKKKVFARTNGPGRSLGKRTGASFPLTKEWNGLLTSCANASHLAHQRVGCARKRRALELSIAHSTDQHLIEELDVSTDTISVWDWPIVLEWNERWQRARLLAKLKAELAKVPIQKNSVHLTALIDRLKEIDSELADLVLQEEPSLLALLLHRWRNASLREEALYLLERREHLPLA